jgi:hypothetical protein
MRSLARESASRMQPNLLVCMVEVVKACVLEVVKACVLCSGMCFSPLTGPFATDGCEIRDD